MNKCLSIMLALALGGCATLSGSLTSAQWRAPLGETGFQAEGRLAAKHSGSGSYANFDWSANKTLQTISLNTPLGNSVGQLCRDSQGVIAQSADGKVFQAASSQELTRQLLGFALPLDHLDSWAQGQWSDDSAHRILSDGALEQDGFIIRRSLTPDGAPRILEVNNDAMSLRLVFDRFEAHSAKAALCPQRH